MKYLTKRQFAQALGVSIRTVERRVNAGHIKLSGRTFGGHWRFTTQELDRCRGIKPGLSPFEKRKRWTETLARLRSPL